MANKRRSIGLLRRKIARRSLGLSERPAVRVARVLTRYGGHVTPPLPGWNRGRQGRKSHRSCRIPWKFNSVAKKFEGPNHSYRVAVLGLFGYCGATFLIRNLFMQKDPDQPAKTIGDNADGLIVSEPRHKGVCRDIV